ncbi:MAG: response regulator transcription factor [Thermomicrobiales bacterium]|nr:response regulator transcription factor [Thermomicrobiales bacterium]
MAERLGLALPLNFRTRVDQAAALAEEALGRTAYLVAWEAGRRNPLPVLQQAIAGGSTHGESGAGDTPQPNITRREREVLELIVAGRTDREIATTLFISERTASKHVSTILQKLDAVSRAEAAVRAVRLGLA